MDNGEVRVLDAESGQHGARQRGGREVIVLGDGATRRTVLLVNCDTAHVIDLPPPPLAATVEAQP